MSISVPLGDFGGGTLLNYKVVGNPQPASPRKNTIWIDTDVEITRHYLQAEQPENMADGEVWILTGKSSTVSFQAVKKNPIMIYPISAKQMVNGVLTDRVAKSWNGSAWVEWIKEGSILIDNGSAKKPIFICWEGKVSEGGSDYSTITEGDGFVTITSNGYGNWAMFVADVDLTYAKKLLIEGEFASDNGELRIWDNVTAAPSSGNSIASIDMTNIGGSLDVSALSGTYKVGFTWVNAQTSKIKNFNFT